MIRAKFTKCFTKGILKGLFITETMPFVSKRRATKWMEQINKSKHNNYVVHNIKIVD